MRTLKIAVAILLLPLPSVLKILCYRLLFGYRIAWSARIGLSIIVARQCVIGRRTRIGHFNALVDVDVLRIGDHVQIGFLNIIRGGRVHIGTGSQIVRFNEINAIMNPIATTHPDPVLNLGAGCVITAWHKIDYTDAVTFGNNVVFAGRNSCIWTHNRQATRPVSIGANCYIGSGVQMVPGSSVPAFCVVGLGSIITKTIEGDYQLIAGAPAKPIKPLAKDDPLITFSTRPDLH